METMSLSRTEAFDAIATGCRLRMNSRGFIEINSASWGSDDAEAIDFFFEVRDVLMLLPIGNLHTIEYCAVFGDEITLRLSRIGGKRYKYSLIRRDVDCLAALQYALEDHLPYDIIAIIHSCGKLWNVRDSVEQMVQELLA